MCDGVRIEILSPTASFIVSKGITVNLNHRSTPALLAVGTLLVAGALTACSVSMSTGVSKSDLDAQALTVLQTKFPDDQIESVSCSDGLDATVGATATCEIVSADAQLTLIATVDDVTDGKVKWSFSEPQ